MRQRDIGSPDGYPHATSLDDKYPASPLAPPTGADEPYVTLHVLRTPPQFGGDTDEATQRRLVAGQSAAGQPPGDLAWIDPDHRTTWSFPRGIVWSDYPVVGTPRLRLVRGERISRARTLDRSRWQYLPMLPEELAESLRHVVFHLPPDIRSDDPTRRRIALEWLGNALTLTDALAGFAPLTLIDAEGTRAGGWDELRAAAAPIAPWLRFHYSYAANFTAIGLKALEAAMEHTDAEAMVLRTRLKGDRIAEGSTNLLRAIRDRALTVEGLLNPLWLQAVYALRRRGRVLVPLLGAKDHDIAVRALATPEGLSYPAWIGSGRYPARPLNRREVSLIGWGMLNTMCVAAHGDDLVLSQTGHRFLDALHHSAEDVDMPVRWAGRDLDASDAESMDRWIARTFRKMKTRVNAL